MSNPKKDRGNEPRLDPFRAALLLLRSHLSPDSAARKAVEGLIRQRNVPMLAGLGKIEDREYHDPSHLSELLVSRQVAALFKKNDAFADSDRCEAKAHSNFELAERICRITNKRLDHYGLRPDRVDPDIATWLKRMEFDIASLLGEVKDFVGAMPSLIRLTSGATEDRPRRRSYPFLKITGKLRAPLAAVPYLGSLLSYFGVDLSLLKFTRVEWNTITLVPKNWETFRTIAKEATHCLPFQLALDSFFKTKLRRWGIDLRSQGKNQELARIGSIDGSVSTIDLRMASDVCSYNTVALLLPFGWFELLCSFRSASYSAPWGSGSYAKFSSMGNGYTFTLETLIFAAACRAVGSRQFAVYGDDIAIDVEHTTSVVKLLRFLGFRLNDAKSFVNPDSRFRESCGCDYYKGALVTPFYLRECPKLSDRAGVSHCLNGLVECVGVPGPLWDWAATLVRQLGLRLVPWNENSRSGVWITPNFAWKHKYLSVCRKRVIKVDCPDVGPPRYRDNPDFGFPVFNGYQAVQERRKTIGWRSLLYWFLKKGSGSEDVAASESNRTSTYLMKVGDRLAREREGTATVTSYVSVRTGHVHRTCRYDPQPYLTPSHLFLWDEVVGGRRR